MNNLACALTGVQGETVPLIDVLVSAALHDLLAEVKVSQTYRNDESVNIEAVYTFPLPLDAVLLELSVEIGGRVLNGVVVGKKVAEEKYEDAIAAGDAAVMLEMIEPELYTMNLGNLLSQEKATITFSYAILYRWAADQLRLFLPTTVAPRYGNSPHAPHQVPESSLTVENQFSLQVEVFGSLREAQFACPSHQVSLTKSAEKVVISLQQAKAVMDRDFILNVRAPQTLRSFAVCDADGDRVAAMASFQPFFPGLQKPRPLNLAIVIDCSGSMEGDSINQAKLALEQIVDALQSHDRVTIIAFGNTTKVLSDQLLICNKANLGKAKRFANQLGADMGGTEIGSALDAAYAAVGALESGDIFLLTDGEVSSWQSVVKDAKRSGHRIFTVGVGSAVSEAFVRGLAASTGGECELVSPGEDMANRVVRHFERMRAPRAKRVAVHWPEGATDLAPTAMGTVFQGDTVIACARFEQAPISGSVILEIETENSEITRQELPISMAPMPGVADGFSTVARLVASARIKDLDDVAGLATALSYRLVSPWTNWLVVAERSEEEKAQGIPAIRMVPQTLAAGWGGAGLVSANQPSMVLRSQGPAVHSVADMQEVSARASVKFSRRKPLEPFRQLRALIDDEPSKLDAKRAFDLLQEAGLKSEFSELFSHAAHLGVSINAVAAMLLARLFQGPLGKDISPKGKAAVESLHVYAERTTVMLRAISNRAIELIRVSEDATRATEALRELERCAANLLQLIKGDSRKTDAIQEIDDRATAIMQASEAATRATEVLREMGRLAFELRKLIEEAVRNGCLELRNAHAGEGMIVKFASTHELLDHLQDYVLRSSERIERN